ncbi:hypothetical protein CPB86DRAFT_730865 [Serendipita vermifera]|nr:hypothetical protein CPB86DRAFT_730865 [Serendipita vermifera]
MFKNILFLCVLTTSMLLAAAYQIVTPNDAASEAPWTANGPNEIVWQRVDTDPETFTIVLVNENRRVLPVNNQFIAANVDGTLLSIAVSPIAGQVFPVGPGFRVNFVKSFTDVNTIYAQSSQFRIKEGSGTASLNGGSTTRPESTIIGNTDRLVLNYVRV